MIPPMQHHRDFAALCGALPSRPSTVEAYQKLRPYRVATVADPPADFLVTRWDVWLRDQERFGSCVGQAIAGAVETQVGDSTRLSGVSIWREARRQQGRIEQIDRGTMVEFGIAAVEDRGYSDPWRDGEDRDKEEAGLGATAAGDDLADELSAFATAHHQIEHTTIWDFGNALIRKLQLALVESDAGVVFATGLRNAFFSLGPDQVATLDHIGGDANGHAMCLVGFRTAEDGKLEFLCRNSWGASFGGATVRGVVRPGLFWCSQDCISVLWELHRLRIVK